MPFDTPVLLLLYNRPDFTESVLGAIRRVQPRQLFVAADGPSAKRDDDQRKCKEVRALVGTVDWDCEIKTLFRDENLGCRQAISSAITWFYEQVDEGIVLEDDCLPSQSFFRFCQELLEKYRNCDDVMVVSGDNFQEGHIVTNDSYYFSRYPHCWGWATWRRAWHKYDDNMTGWPDFRTSQEFKDLGANDSNFKSYWTSLFDRMFAGEIDTWDYPWTFSCWVNGGLTALPAVNLVKNIGFGLDATHTVSACPKISAMQAGELNFPLKHPPRVCRNIDADKFTDMHHYNIVNRQDKSIVRRIKDKLKSRF